MPQYDNIIENVTYNSTLRLTGSEWDNTLVRNVVIENVNGNGALLRDVDNVTFENVTIRNVSGDGIKLSTQGSTSNVVISNSDISRVGEDGINAGQRYEQGVSHPGLQIIGNTIDQTGLNGGNDGLRHGIYVQSRDVLIQDNRVTNSEDGNGISVRSSGIVKDNYVEGSNDSGIAYFADHMGSDGTLRIEGNTVVDSGYGNGRSDIDLLSVPNQNYRVDSFIINSNNLERGAAGVRVGNGYNDAVVDINGNVTGTGTISSDSGSERPVSAPAVDDGLSSSTIQGDNGSNILRGTSNDDSFYGLAGADVFVMAKGGGTDTIEDFQPGVDRVFVYGFNNANSVGDLLSLVSERDGDTVLSFGNGDNLVFADTNLNEFSSGDFLFG
ncbi:MAG: right-handed parallel beta-helix repeat-containing protein [Paracoccus sp. (in: a-proteobacteria)]|uniref:right-handed parallel beta-helix repeat-containing protein n=1 Tax=Paracoccus sp. TaxID=267 RepID=UPI004057E18D